MTSANVTVGSNRAQGPQLRAVAARLTRSAGSLATTAATSLRMAHELRNATTDHQRRRIVDRYISSEGVV